MYSLETPNLNLSLVTRGVVQENASDKCSEAFKRHTKLLLLYLCRTTTTNPRIGSQNFLF